MMAMDTLPLARVHGETLNDDSIILEYVLARNVWIGQISVVRRLGNRTRWWRPGFQDDLHQLDGRRAGIAAPLILARRGVEPDDTAISPKRRPPVRFRLQYPAFDEDQQL